MEQAELLKVLETLLFITDQPIDLKKLCRITEVADEAAVREGINELQRQYFETGRAIQLIEVAGGWQMSTKPEYGRWVRRLFNEKLTLRLSAAALETLAIIAYRQPLTRAEIEVIRGVEVIAPLETLVNRGLVKVAGRRESVGRPLLYGTSEDFLRLFGLNSLDDLPKLEAFAPKPQQDGAQPQSADGQPGLFDAPQPDAQPAEPADGAANAVEPQETETSGEQQQPAPQTEAEQNASQQTEPEEPREAAPEPAPAEPFELSAEPPQEPAPAPEPEPVAAAEQPPAQEENLFEPQETAAPSEKESGQEQS